MNKKRITLLMAMIFLPTISFAGFLVDDGAPTTTVPSNVKLLTSPTKALPPIVATPYASKSAAPVSVGQLSNSAIPVPLKVHVVQVGTVGNFGGDVYSPQNATIIRVVNAVVPNEWNVIFDKNIDMNKPSSNPSGGRSPNWIDAIDEAIVNTDYVATIDWSSHTVDLSEIVFHEPVVTANSNTSLKNIAPKPVPVQKWTLTGGNPLSKELTKWGDSAGWKVVWNDEKDWLVPTDSIFTGSFQAAASNVINSLSKNGAIIRAQFFMANKTMVVTGAPE